jgi:hypothetical protein
MNFEIFKPEEYKNCKIYYRYSGSHWEYLTVINNEIYEASIEVKPTFLNRLMFFLGIEKSRYSYQQQINILKYLRKYAETTVDYILNKK